MKIVILVQNLSVGGIQRLIVDEANELSRRGIETHIITFEKDRAANSMTSELDLRKDRITFIDYPRMRDIGGFFSLVRALRRIRPDVVFTHHWFANTVGRLAASLAGIRKTFSFEHSIYDEVKSARQFLFDQLLQRLSQKVIAVSDSVKNSLIEHGIKARLIVVLPNGLNLSRYKRKAHETKKKPLTALFAGRLVRDKGADIFINALSQTERVEGVIAGDGPERERLESLTAKLGLGKRIRFLGTRDDIRELLASVDYLVVPSRREGFGLVIVEARAYGLPVIGTKIGGIPDLIKDGVNGLLIPPDNVSALAEAMRRLSDDSFRTLLAQEAPKGIERYSIEKHVQALLALL